LEIVFLNVSMGDATLIRAANRTVLFDAGPAEQVPALVNKLRARGVSKLDILVLSSNDPAFVGGAQRILQEFPVDEVWTNGLNYSDLTWSSLQPYLDAGKTRAVSYGDSQVWGNFKLEVLNPQPGLLRISPDADSIVLKATYGSFCTLLFSNSLAAGASASDAGTVFGGVDSRIISGPIPVACPVLKVSHHGSANAASFQLLNAASPADAIISVGPNPPQNLYPEPALIRRLMLRNASVWTTDRLGDITVSSDGSAYAISSRMARDSKYGRFIESVANTGASYWQAPTGRR
jgi:beta-lactamase superfamily II metal-dependent hydrolase